MFQIDEYVIHMTGGICQVKDIAPIELPNADKDKLYYLLVPVKNAGSKVFVPVDNDSAIRKICTPEQANELIEQIPEIEELVIDNEKFRETRYKEVIKSCDLHELVGIIKSLYTRKEARIAAGKKITATDDKYFRIAEDNLINELCFVLGREKDDVKAIINTQIAC